MKTSMDVTVRHHQMHSGVCECADSRVLNFACESVQNPV